MPVVLELRRGDSTTIAGITPAAGELIFDTDDLSLRAGDGAQAGGWILGGSLVTDISATTHTVDATDQGHVLNCTNAGATTITLATPSVANNFNNGQGIWVLATGAGGTTITPPGGVTINGGSSISLATGDFARVISDGTNYIAGVLVSGGGTGTVTSVSSGNGLTGGPITSAGTLRLATTHTTKTTNYTVQTTDSGVDFDNIGAGGTVIFTLPAAAANLGPFGFLVDASHTVEVLCGSGDKIASGGTNSASTGNIQSATPFSYIQVKGFKSGQWVVVSSVGSWTIT